MVNIILGNPTASIALQSEAPNLTAESGRIVHPALPRVTGGTGGGFAASRDSLSHTNLCVLSTEPCKTSSALRVLRHPRCLCSCTLESDPPLCSSPHKPDKAWELSSLTSSG